MSNNHLKIIGLSAFIAISVACHKSSNSSSSTCTASTGDLGPLPANQSVLYTASATGGATLTSVTYQDSAGMTTVKNPSSSFSKTVNVKSGSTVDISASGNIISGGTISVTSNGISFQSANCQ
jgi:hypothetical protein